LTFESVVFYEHVLVYMSHLFAGTIH